MLEPFALDRAGARVGVSGSAWLQPPGSLSPSGSGAVTPWAALPSVQSFSFIITALCAVLFLQYSRHLQWPQVQLLLPQSKHPILGEGTCWILLFGSFYCFFFTLVCYSGVRDSAHPMHRIPWSRPQPPGEPGTPRCLGTRCLQPRGRWSSSRAGQRCSVPAAREGRPIPAGLRLELIGVEMSQNLK